MEIRENKIFRGCIYLHMNNMPPFNVLVFKPSSGRCYYGMLSHPKNYFEMKKIKQKIEKNLSLRLSL